MAGREHKLSFVVHQQDDGSVARCVDVNVASEGDSEADAVANLREALELYFEDAQLLDISPVRHARLDNPTKRLSSEEICTVLRRHGFVLVGKKGLHAKYRRARNPPRTVIVIIGRESVRAETLHSIIEQAGLSEGDF